MQEKPKGIYGFDVNILAMDEINLQFMNHATLLHDHDSTAVMNPQKHTTLLYGYDSSAVIKHLRCF